MVRKIRVDVGRFKIVNDLDSFTGYTILALGNDRYGRKDTGIPASVFEVALWDTLSLAIAALNEIASGCDDPSAVSREALLKINTAWKESGSSEDSLSTRQESQD